MTTTDILKVEFEAIRKELVKRHDELGMRASGKWANSLEVEISKTDGKSIAKLYGEKYTEQLVFGRKSGKFPPIKAIEQWIIDKGIQPIESDLKISTLAFLIARKIAREGTKYYQQGGTDLVASVVTPERIQSIINQVREINVVTLTRGLVEQLKAVA